MHGECVSDGLHNTEDIQLDIERVMNQQGQKLEPRFLLLLYKRGPFPLHALPLSLLRLVLTLRGKLQGVIGNHREPLLKGIVH